MVIHVAHMSAKNSHLQIDENWFRTKSCGIPGATVTGLLGFGKKGTVQNPSRFSKAKLKFANASLEKAMGIWPTFERIDKSKSFKIMLYSWYFHPI